MDPVRKRTPDLHAEEARDGMELKQIAGWTVAALLAVAAVTGLARTDIGEKRITQLTKPTQVSLPVTLERTPEQQQAARLTALREETAAETRKLQEALHGMNVEREQLLSRLDALERQVGDVTASIPRGRQSDPPTTVEVDAGTGVLPVTSSLSASPTAEASQLSQVPFGVDLGADNSLDAARGRWNKLKSAYPQEFASLRPVLSVREVGKAGRLELRLIAGPLTDASSAARLCARLTAGAAKLFCEPAAFDGQRLATR